MPEGSRPRRRRGRRGGGQRALDAEARQPDAASSQAPGDDLPPGPSFGARAPRRDNRRASRPDGALPGPPPGPPGAGESSGRASPAAGRSIRRAPTGDAPRRQSGGRRGPDDRRPSAGSPRRNEDRGRPRSEDRGPRVFETPVPQDERSVELGAAFREAQMAMRDARKALDKRKAEYSDEPEWLIVQLTEAEARFTAAAEAWAAHLETTGRKVVRNR
jgi:hypothetical protein